MANHEGLVATRLGKRFGHRAVVDGLSISVEPGEIVGLLGPNGAGKTTCFGMITGTVVPDRGSVDLGGVRLDGMPLWRRIRAGLGYLPQHPVGFRRLTVRQNLQIACGRGGKHQQDIDGLLQRLGLSKVERTPAGALSGGERRRLELARCLATKPKVMLLDEPFAGVDPVAVSALQAQIRELAASGIGILVTDHAVRETLGICDRAIIVDAGVSIAEGTPSAVSADERVRSRYLGWDFTLP